MSQFNRRRIAVVVTHRAPYGRLKPVMRAIQEHPGLELQVIVGTPMSVHGLVNALRHGEYASFRTTFSAYTRARLKTLLRGGDVSRHDLLARLVKSDGFEIHRYLPMFLDGGGLATMLKIQGNVLFKLSNVLRELKPDVLLVHADRFEMLPVAMAGAILNIPVAHTQGGDVSGTIDESIRHAITKLAHIHFPTTELSKKRIVQMGEDPRYVHMVGCPTIDALMQIDFSIDERIYERNGNGYGDRVDLHQPYLLLMQHPVTTEYEHSKRNMGELLKAVQDINMPTLMFWPNIDGGTDGASQAVREFLEDNTLPALTLFKTFAAEDFYRALNSATVAVGNSSSFIREASFLGTPVVLVGTRQQERERAHNVVQASYDASDIAKKIRAQLAHGRYQPSNLYGDGSASVRIAEILATINLPPTQKRFRAPDGKFE